MFFPWTASQLMSVITTAWGITQIQRKLTLKKLKYWYIRTLIYVSLVDLSKIHSYFKDNFVMCSNAQHDDDPQVYKYMQEHLYFNK
jgi:hypothetical protein